jgi:hypothetical protein
MDNQNNWPKIGDRLTFNGVPKFFYPHFVKVGKYAEENLTKENEYIVTKCEVYSSWCAVWLEGHGDNLFNLSFFKDWQKYGK